MEELLTPVSQTYRRPTDEAELLTVSKYTTAKPVTETRSEFKGSSPEEALEALKSQPGHETLLSVLAYLQKGVNGKHPFNVKTPSPQGAQIVHVLVTEIVPNYWTVLNEGSSSKKRSTAADCLVSCLQSIPGINAGLAYLRALIREAKSNPQGLKQSHAAFNLGFVLELLSQILQYDDEAKRIWSSISSSVDNPSKLRPLRQEFISLIASGKILSLCAEGEDVLKEADNLDNPLWVADAKEYVLWLGRNLVSWTKSADSVDEFKLVADILSRALKLGHYELLIQLLLTDLLLQENHKQSAFTKLVDSLPQSEQRKLLFVVLKLLSSQYLISVDSDAATENYPLVWAAAGVIAAVLGDSGTRRGHLVSWLTGAVGAGIGETSGIRRAAVAVLADNKEAITTVVEKNLSQFGDQLYIRHVPMLQQEAHAQVLLLSAGYLHRISPIKLTVILRSSTYLNTISNRIAASQTRIGFLGMVVGEALSGLVHKDDKKLDFHMDETNTEEASWYKSLVHVSDKIGPTNPLQTESSSERPRKASKPTKSTPKPAQPSRVPPKNGFIIEEVEDDGSEEDDLVPYGKPDSDAEDSDDDPTLINRDKPKAPVYIRDLITYFRDTQNFDCQKLALTTAPTLIRRKANYGTEVSSHIEELATLLVGLEDKYELEDFHNLRLQGMIAVIIAQPQKMGQWFAKTFFDGDYSLGQRASVLVVLGLSGREIAGFDISEYADAASFPSKQLPSKLEKHYSLPSATDRLTSSTSHLKALPPNAVDNISQTLSQNFLAPLAAEAADAATGPDALKLSSFTSRLQSNNAMMRGKSKPRGIRSIPNTTASLLATSFFFPLTSRFQAALHSSSAARGVLFQPSLLVLYIKTLALLLHAAGPSTLALPQMTTEFWDLLLGVRGQCIGNMTITQAVLFGLMALLDVNEGDMRGLCERQGREVVESVEWVSGVFDQTLGGDAGGDGEENQVKMMAAGVLIRLKEAVEKYRALLMGDLIGVA
ncbi:telomere length regulation protein [Pseudomassariella vexata]|uniref:Telomere length regulation protein n=1 Tax=Pseudomassariella vexata TaxID=1141098 RepID=A0A1Y2DDW6_9PEZI|nr:telomere length regulation protein [Pseudomassariella vexata]ORY57471.1 telomere length regulation protein [Pseudomassariella vexata]